MTEIILRRDAVERMTGLSRSTIYDWIAKGTFPKPIKLGDRAVGWRGRDIQFWANERESAGACFRRIWTCHLDPRFLIVAMLVSLAVTPL